MKLHTSLPIARYAASSFKDDILTERQSHFNLHYIYELVFFLLHVTFNMKQVHSETSFKKKIKEINSHNYRRAALIVNQNSQDKILKHPTCMLPAEVECFSS